MSSSCIVKNVDAFCNTFTSISLNTGSFNNTKVDVELLGETDADLNYGPLHSIKDQFKNVLPFFAEENWKVTSASCSKSESGVVTKYSLQDLYSLDANNHFIGLTNRVGGDTLLGSEYYPVSGVPDPYSYSVPVDMLISRSLLLSYHNRLKDGQYYINSNGQLKLNTNHFSNKNTGSVEDLNSKGGFVGTYPNPNFDFGNVLYRFADLFGSSKHPIGGEANWHVGIDGLYDDTGTFFSVLNSILAPYQKVFVANPFLGGYYVHSPGQDFGKIDVLKNAGIEPPESSISSSISKDYYSGYSTGAFLRTFRNGYMEDPPEIESNSGSSAVSYTNWQYHSDEESTSLFPLNTALYRTDPPAGWGRLISGQSSNNFLAYQLAAAALIETDLALDYHKFREVSDNVGQTTDDDQKKIILDRRSDSLPYGTNIDDYYIFESTTIPSLIESALADYSVLGTVNGSNAVVDDLMGSYKAGGNGNRVHPDMLDFFCRKRNTLRYTDRFDTDIITRNGHPTASAIYSTGIFGFENFGTANDVRGSRKWFSDTGHEVLFVPLQMPISSSPFSWFSSWASGGQSGANMTVQQFFSTFLSESLTDPYSHLGITGIIMIDKGDVDISAANETVSALIQDEIERAQILIDTDAVVEGSDTNRGVMIVPRAQVDLGYQTRIKKLFVKIAEAYSSVLEDSKVDDGINWAGTSSESVWYYGNVNNGTSVLKSHNSIQGNNTRAGSLPNRNSVSNIVTAERFNVDRFESFQGDAGTPHPNRSIKTFEKEFSNFAGPNGKDIIYVTQAGKVGQAAYNSAQGNIVYVDNLSKISFTLINELIDFDSGEAKQKNWKQYLESMDISVSGGILTANYTFSQKVMLPDFLSIENSKASLQNLLK